MRKTAHKVNNKRSVELENQLKRALADYANLQKRVKDILEAENVKEISVEGGFNPQLHEGIATVEGDREGAIAEVLQKGYLIGDKVLRPARVKVTAVNKESRSVNG